MSFEYINNEDYDENEMEGLFSFIPIIGKVIWGTGKAVVGGVTSIFKGSTVSVALPGGTTPVAPVTIPPPPPPSSFDIKNLILPIGLAGVAAVIGYLVLASPRRKR